MLQSTGKEAPHSHQAGEVAIVGMFATPEIVCTNSYLLPHGAGIGIHCFQVHYFDAHSILGTKYPKTTRPSGRALQCKVAQTVKKYNTVLKQLLVRHRSFEKLGFLQQNSKILMAAELQLMFNQWDWEVTCYMLGLEKRCNKYRKGSIKFIRWSDYGSVVCNCIVGSDATTKIGWHMQEICFGPVKVTMFPTQTVSPLRK